MATLADAYVQILPTTKGFKSKLESQVGGEAGSAGTSIGKSLGSGLVGAITGVIAAAGIGAIFKNAIDAGADLQQSIGGVETLYGDAADAIKGYASQAYQYGLSANDYMEQSTSFAASLKQSLGGDVVAAAEAANTALEDMADNSAKMGTDMASIQNAYQGFAKGNYTMLDNLKLGYGGTKTEMERLLADATKLSGVEYDIDNLSDVYSAIHVIQEDLGLTGVAADEAKTTFTGSMQAMKAAATNFLGNLALGQDVGPALTDLVETVGTFLTGNLIPMVGNIISAIPDVVVSLASVDWIGMGTDLISAFIGGVQGMAMSVLSVDTTVIDSFLASITENLPNVLESGSQAVVEFANGVLENIPGMIEAGGQMIDKFINFLMENYPTYMQKGGEMVGQLAQGIIGNLPKIAESVVKVVIQIVSTIARNLPRILQSGVEMLASIAAGIIKGIPQAVGAIPQVIAGIKRKFDETDWKSIGTNIIKGIANGIKNGVSTIANAAKEAAKSALDSAKDFLGIKSPSRVMRDQVGKMIASGMAIGITQNENLVTSAMNELTDDLTNGVSGNVAIGARVGQSLFDSASNGILTTSMNGGYTQNVTINAPTELSPSEIARQTRNATRNMVLAMGV